MSTQHNSKAFKRFDDTFKRSAALAAASEHLRKLQTANPNVGPLGLTVNIPSDMLRSALVLCVAAMDAYFTDRFSEGLGPFLRARRGLPPDLISLIEDAGFDTNQAIDAMLTMERPMRRVGSLLKEHLSGSTTTNISRIDDLYFKVGIKDFCHHVVKKAKKPKLTRLLQKAVQRRHEIVHAGDKNNHGKLQAIDLATLKKTLLGIQNFVASADELLAKALPVPPPPTKRRPKAAVTVPEQAAQDLSGS